MKKVLSVILCSLICASFIACSAPEESVSSVADSASSKEEEVAAKPTTTPSPKPTPTIKPSSSEAEVEIDPATINLLTGEPTLTEEAQGKRPVAVMVNNAVQNLPQYGIAQADIIFEVQVEGDMTRLMAMYGDYTQMPDVCSVRSCRFYFPMISESFDAVYVHWGSEQNFAQSKLYELDVDTLDGIYNSYNLFGRDQDRLNSGYASEHSSVVYTSRLEEKLDGSNMRMDILEEKEDNFFEFTYDEVSEGVDVENFQLHFGSYYSDFEYDEENKVYLKEHNGSPHMDGKTDTQLAFKNLLLLETYVGMLPNNNTGLKDVSVTGNNEFGYYVTNGKAQEISWSKANGEGKLELFDSDGNELELNVGKTYVTFASSGTVPDFN